MKDLLAGYSLRLKEWRTIRSVLLHLKQNGKSAQDLVIYINEITAEEKAFQDKLAKQLIQIVQKCPEDGAWMRLLEVNVSPATQTGDDSGSVWLCQKCMYTIYNKETVMELRSKGGT